MDITPVYELRERLKVGAVAGTGLITEDFRLRRALENLAPLEKASPVFARIGQLARAVLEENCPDRAGALLDALTLVDAVLCTQGVVDAGGELRPLPAEKEELPLSVTEVPYSVLSALLDALCRSGSGRYSYVVELRREHPELFQDYRVQSALVAALGASYGELAENAAEWLIQDGHSSPHTWEAINPLLRKGFDPKGGKEMVRRIRVMEELAGAKANSFYLEQLPQAAKDVRTALIHALGCSQENQELLLRIRAEEKGNNKKMVHYVLASMEGEEVWKFFRTLAEKKPREALTFLEWSSREEASEILAQIFLQVLDQWQKGERKADKDTYNILETCLQTLPRKRGEAACRCYRAAAALGTGLDVPWEGTKDIMQYYLPLRAYQNMDQVFSQVIGNILQYTLLLAPDPELAVLARELYDAYGGVYFPAAMAGALETRSPEECQELLEDFLSKSKGKSRKELQGRVWQALECLKADEAGNYTLCTMDTDMMRERQRMVCHPGNPVSPGMYDLLMSLKDSWTDRLLAGWIRPREEEGREELCNQVGAYLYSRALAAKDNYEYLEPLKKWGFKECSGLAVNHFSRKRTNSVSAWSLECYFRDIPGSPESRAAEARGVLELFKCGRLKGAKGCTEFLEEYIACPNI